MLRSLRLGEADRVLHLYTLAGGRAGAVAKGIRKTRSRFGARLEPLSHVQVALHQGRGELGTVTGVDLITSTRRPVTTRTGSASRSLARKRCSSCSRSRRRTSARSMRSRASSISPTRFPVAPASRSSTLLAISFQLKLLWLAGYLPHLEAASSAAAARRSRILAARGRSRVPGVRRRCDPAVAARDRPHRGLLRRPLADAADAGLTDRDAREALRVVVASHEFHGGFRLRTLAG